MTRALFALIALILVTLAPAPAGAQAPAAEEGFDGLVIRVYDLTGIDRDQRAEAIRVASSLLVDAGVDAEWLDCRRLPGSTASPCDSFRRPTDLIVRIVHGALAAELPGRPALGVSIVDATAHTGVLATVFLNRLAPVVGRTGANPTLLLARVIAHEVGHLLLRTNDHMPTGLMRATWTDRELALNRPQDWVFGQTLRLDARYRAPRTY